MAAAYAFDDPGEGQAFPEQDEVQAAATRVQQVQSQFDQDRQRRDYIEKIRKGANAQRGAVRQSIQG